MMQRGPQEKEEQGKNRRASSKVVFTCQLVCWRLLKLLHFALQGLQTEPETVLGQLRPHTHEHARGQATCDLILASLSEWHLSYLFSWAYMVASLSDISTKALSSWKRKVAEWKTGSWRADLKGDLLYLRHPVCQHIAHGRLEKLLRLQGDSRDVIAAKPQPAVGCQSNAYSPESDDLERMQGWPSTETLFCDCTISRPLTRHHVTQMRRPLTNLGRAILVGARFHLAPFPTWLYV